MPYFSHSMARSIQQSTGSGTKVASTSGRTTRSMPGASQGPIHKNADGEKVAGYKLQMTKRKVLFMRSLLHAQINQLNSNNGAYPVEGHRSLFNTYEISRKSVRCETADMKMYDAKNVKVNCNLIVRIYSRADKTKDLYLKILQHLGRKHPYIIHTWEVFCDSKEVYVFQELASKGNLADYYAKADKVNEKQAAFWAKQVFRALDFLGDQASAHRDISPSHLMVLPPTPNGEIWLKLTGFSQAIIYWDIHTNDVNYCQCWPLEKPATNFQAPEVYSKNHESEQFDPIQADLWSYGANVFYILSKEYPYNVVSPAADINGEIMHNVKKLPISNECQLFLGALLQANANDRMPFDFIETHPWFVKHTFSKSIKATAKDFKEGKVSAKVEAFPDEAVTVQEAQPQAPPPIPGGNSSKVMVVKEGGGSSGATVGSGSIGGQSGISGGASGTSAAGKSTGVSRKPSMSSKSASAISSAKPKSVSSSSKAGGTSGKPPTSVKSSSAIKSAKPKSASSSSKKGG